MRSSAERHHRARTPVWVYGLVATVSLAVGVGFSALSGNPLW
ncbi:MAG: hypothetical protein ABW122_08515 [Ilumatobacteraceae bacterium]